MTYEQTMAWGAAQYADVVEALMQLGLAAEFTQTGGMCAAVFAPLEAGHYLLVTDAEEPLPWDRRNLQGWYAGLYRDDSPSGTAPLRWAQEDLSGSIDDLLALVREVLRPSRHAAAG